MIEESTVRAKLQDCAAAVIQQKPGVGCLSGTESRKQQQQRRDSALGARRDVADACQFTKAHGCCPDTAMR